MIESFDNAYVMTYARSEIVDSESVGVYHCVSRCVRRAFLCGYDKYSGKSFEHRRLWIRKRLKFLVEVFAIEGIAYAVLDNHLHILIRTRPDLVKTWTAIEIARRWRLLFPIRHENGLAAEPSLAEISAISGNEKLVELYRARLSSISWFNRCLNEEIAKAANNEDNCKGRFWEGRFKCQRVFDVAGILACSAYIDLNPIRTGISKTLEGSDHTSIQDRIYELKHNSLKSDTWPKIPLLSIPEISEGALSTSDYFKMVDETGRLIRENKLQISDDIEPILERLKLNKNIWVSSTSNFSKQFRRLVGPEAHFSTTARRAKKNWFHGVAVARLLFRN